MDYRINQEGLNLNETIFDECKEQPIDIDFTLPDYCPDIQRILKCQIYPQITSRNISSNRLEIDGKAIVSLLYIDASRMTIRLCEHSVPFICSFALSAVGPDLTFFTSTKVEYVNCRAVSPRRLDIHGAFSVFAKVQCKKREDIVCRIDGSGIEQKKITAKACNVVGTGMIQFSVSEVMEISADKPEVESLIKAEAKVILSDYKSVTDKVIIKGDAHIRILYISDIETGQLNTIEYAIPVSQIVDVGGSKEDCDCDVKLEIISHSIRPKLDSTGQDSLFEINLHLAAAATVYEEKDIEMIQDAYSTKYEMEPIYKQIELPRLLCRIGDSFSDKNIIDTNNNSVSKVLDLWNEMLFVNAKKEDDGVSFKGRLNACVLAMDQEENLFYTEKIIDFEYFKNIDNLPNNIICETDARLISLGYKIDGENKIEIKFDIKLFAPLYERKRYNTISDILIDEEKLKIKENLAALTIYYADPGEDIWNIAQKYCTSVDSIKKQNDLQSDVLPHRSMLLI